MLGYKVNDHLKSITHQSEATMKEEILHEISKNNPRSMEWIFFKICRNGKFLGCISCISKHCRFLHHNDPYLKLAPFKLEQYSTKPYLVIFHDILSNGEISFIVNKSKPILSRTRTFDSTSEAINIHEIKSGKKRRVVHKTVQSWIKEVEFEKLSESSAGKKMLKASVLKRS